MNDVKEMVQKQVTGAKKMAFLPKHFGYQGVVFEDAVYSRYRKLVPTYQGGSWNYFEVCNGAVFMQRESEESCELCVQGNGFQQTVNPRVAGIIVTLFTLNRLTGAYAERNPKKAISFDAKYHLLLDYVAQLPATERGLIFQAID